MASAPGSKPALGAAAGLGNAVAHGPNRFHAVPMRKSRRIARPYQRSRARSMSACSAASSLAASRRLASRPRSRASPMR